MDKKGFIFMVLIYLIVIFGSMWLFLFISSEQDPFYIGIIYGIWVSIFTWWWFIKIPSDADKREHNKDDNKKLTPF